MRAEAKKENSDQRICLYVSDRVKDEIRAAAAAQRRSVNNWVGWVLEQQLQQQQQKAA